MEKDFSKWFTLKKLAHETTGTALFHEREVWWCMLGANGGFEIDGSGSGFARPVVIIKKFNLDTCIVVPLTGKIKNGKFYFKVGVVDDREASAVLSQLRLVDRKRLTKKIETMPKTLFKELLAAIVQINFTYHDRG
ncbi:MAG: type II toxin-antitoxin system PemK/MazF family toxin [Candidatus Kaiserbacteria bacterium]|nr:type II toxin-antitoxin system PemK/MazF family toxin [Candidatus Kaiserbacteria bacterium]